MTGDVVLDTTVAGFYIREDSRLELYRESLHEATVILSFQSVAELRLGARTSAWGPRRRAGLEEYLRGCVIWGYDADLGSQWVELVHSAQRTGRRLETADAWIAATAALLGVPLLTHDRDFTRIRHPHLTVVCHAP